MKRYNLNYDETGRYEVDKNYYTDFPLSEIEAMLKIKQEKVIPAHEAIEKASIICDNWQDVSNYIQKRDAGNDCVFTYRIVSDNHYIAVYTRIFPITHIINGHYTNS